MGDIYLKKYISVQEDCRFGGISNVGTVIGAEKQNYFYGEQKRLGTERKITMTNYDRIRNKSVEEVAEFICDIQNAPCHFCYYRKHYGCGGGYDTGICRKGVIKMLESEVEGE